MDWASFGQKVRERRTEENWSQEELATKVGISRNYLSQIERGEATNLSWKVVQSLATVLGLGLDASEEQRALSNLPAGLEEFVSRHPEVSPEDIEMLARIQYRGRRPSTHKEWELLYNAIRIVAGEQ
jgi:transcriptional regulator with XRE-family HTH domain